MLGGIGASVRVKYRMPKGITTCFQSYFSTQATDYYTRLGVTQKADRQQIKSAFYKLAKQYHPDVAKDSGEKFKQINEAFEVLSDERKRKDYDEQLKTGGKSHYSSGFRANRTHQNWYSAYQQSGNQQDDYYSQARRGRRKNSQNFYQNRDDDDDFNAYYNRRYGSYKRASEDENTERQRRVNEIELCYLNKSYFLSGKNRRQVNLKGNLRER